METEGVKCHTCSHSKLLSDAEPTYECHKVSHNADVMALLYTFVQAGNVSEPFVVQSNATSTHDAWPLRFGAANLSRCEGHSSYVNSKPPILSHAKDVMPQ